MVRLILYSEIYLKILLYIYLMISSQLKQFVDELNSQNIGLLFWKSPKNANFSGYSFSSSWFSA